jgi:hypothetical protein
MRGAIAPVTLAGITASTPAASISSRIASASQPPWIDPVLRVRIARARPLADRRQPQLRHQPPHPATTNLVAIAPKTARHPAAAIPWAVRECRVDHVISASVSSVSGNRYGVRLIFC